MFKKNQIDYADAMMISLACVMSIPALGLVVAAAASLPVVEVVLATLF